MIFFVIKTSIHKPFPMQKSQTPSAHVPYNLSFSMSLITQNHSMVEVAGISGGQLVQPPAQAGSSQPGHPELCPDSF